MRAAKENRDHTGEGHSREPLDISLNAPEHKRPPLAPVQGAGSQISGMPVTIIMTASNFLSSLGGLSVVKEEDLNLNSKF